MDRTDQRPAAPSAPEEASRSSLGLHLGLFLATCFTTAWAGASYHHPSASFGELWQHLADGIPFAASLLAILVTHEAGHYVLGRIHHVAVSLPYFIPLPFVGMIGTMGAVIRMGNTRRRDALADIGAAGPIAGLVVAVPVLVLGLSLSEVKPAGSGLLEGNSALYLLLKLVVTGRILPGDGLDVHLHSVAWAGWVGLLVTMINLMPIGQLDGGHIAFAYFGGRHDQTSRLLHRLLLLLALAASSYTVLELWQKLDLLHALALGGTAGVTWLVAWALLWLVRRLSGGEYHPPVADEPLSPGRRRLCQAMLIVFLVVLTPIPLRLTVGDDLPASQPAASQPAAGVLELPGSDRRTRKGS